MIVLNLCIFEAKVFIRNRFRCCHCHHHHYLKISLIGTLLAALPNLQDSLFHSSITTSCINTLSSLPSTSSNQLTKLSLKGGMTGMHEMHSISWERKRLKNLKLSLRKSRYVFSYQWKSGNAIKQIHISQLTNPTQKTFLGPDYSANVSFLLNSFCQVTFLE